jgi:hypothetical protein
MGTSLRYTLRLAITACRRLLEQDYLLQIEGCYSIRPNQAAVPSFRRSQHEK